MDVLLLVGKLGVNIRRAAVVLPVITLNIQRHSHKSVPVTSRSHLRNTANLSLIHISEPTRPEPI
eukprot:3774316-Pyramimonas_sp.AAC.1